MPPVGEGNSERGVSLPLALSPPWNAPASSTAAPSDRSRSLGWGRGKRQTDSIPSESGKRRSCSESKGQFPELSRGQREEVGGQRRVGGRETECWGVWDSATPYPVLLCCGMRSGSWG